MFEPCSRLHNQPDDLVHSHFRRLFVCSRLEHYHRAPIPFSCFPAGFRLSDFPSSVALPHLRIAQRDRHRPRGVSKHPGRTAKGGRPSFGPRPSDFAMQCAGTRTLPNITGNALPLRSPPATRKFPHPSSKLEVARIGPDPRAGRSGLLRIGSDRSPGNPK